MSRILVSGSIAYDRIMDFPGLFRDHFLPDKLHSISVSFNVETVALNFGGTAGNVAYNLSLFGLEPRIIATAGSDFARYAQYLESRGIDTASVHLRETELTSAAFVMTDQANNQIAAFSVGAGGNGYLPMPATGTSDLAIVGAGCIRDMQSLPAHYRRASLPFIFDPGQAIPALSAGDLQEGISGAAAVFGNDYEFGLIADKTGWDVPRMLEHAGAVVITYGGKGSRIFTKEGKSDVPAVRVHKAIDPTGAGDAYRAGYIAGYLKKLPPAACAKLGSVAGAYAVEQYGTQNHSFTMPEFADRYARAYGETMPL